MSKPKRRSTADALTPEEIRLLSMIRDKVSAGGSSYLKFATGTIFEGLAKDFQNFELQTFAKDLSKGRVPRNTPMADMIAAAKLSEEDLQIKRTWQTARGALFDVFVDTRVRAGASNSPTEYFHAVMYAELIDDLAGSRKRDPGWRCPKIWSSWGVGMTTGLAEFLVFALAQDGVGFMEKLLEDVHRAEARKLPVFKNELLAQHWMDPYCPLFLMSNDAMVQALESLHLAKEATRLERDPAYRWTPDRQRKALKDFTDRGGMRPPRRCIIIKDIEIPVTGIPTDLWRFHLTKGLGTFIPRPVPEDELEDYRQQKVNLQNREARMKAQKEELERSDPETRKRILAEREEERKREFEAMVHSWNPQFERMAAKFKNTGKED